MNYLVDIEYRRTNVKTFSVTAETFAEARELAIEMAGGEWPEKHDHEEIEALNVWNDVDPEEDPEPAPAPPVITPRPTAGLSASLAAATQPRARRRSAAEMAIYRQQEATRYEALRGAPPVLNSRGLPRQEAVFVEEEEEETLER